MDEEINYPSIETAIRANQIAGEDGSVRDLNGLGSALAAPKNAAAYENADIVEQAAILIQRVALAHPFVDGNKRAAFILGSSFLLINGYQIQYEDEQEEMDLAVTIEAMVAEKNYQALVDWIRAHVAKMQDDEG